MKETWRALGIYGRRKRKEKQHGGVAARHELVPLCPVGLTLLT